MTEIQSEPEKREYFLYRHIRLDTNLPFYIGVGTKPKKYASYKVEFTRAFKKSERSQFWKNVVNLANYKVEILFESDSKEEIFKKEIEFIALYGRDDLGLGTLCNHTDGGDGNFGWTPTQKQILAFTERIKGNIWRTGSKLTEEHKEIIRKTHLGKTVSKEHISKLIERSKGNKYCEGRFKFVDLRLFSFEGDLIRKYTSVNEAAKFHNITTATIYNNLKGKSEYTKFGLWKIVENENESFIKPFIKTTIIQSNSKDIVVLDLNGNFIKEFRSIAEASKYLNVSSSNISKVCLKLTQYTGEYIFIYKEQYDENEIYSIRPRETHSLKQIEARLKAGEKNKGRIVTKEVRNKISKGLGISVICIETGIVYDSCNQAGKIINTSAQNLKSSIDENRSCKGFTFKFINKNN